MMTFDLCPSIILREQKQRSESRRRIKKKSLPVDCQSSLAYIKENIYGRTSLFFPLFSLSYPSQRRRDEVYNFGFCFLILDQTSLRFADIYIPVADDNKFPEAGFCCVFCFSNQTDGLLYSSSFIIEFWFDYLYPFTWLHLNPDWLLIRCLISLVEFDGLVKSP